VTEPRDEVIHHTPWVDLVARHAPEGGEPHYVVTCADYVTVLAITPQGTLPLVRQLRPAVGKATLELPAGHVDPGEAPAATAARELAEETGWRAGRVEPLAVLLPDTGRLGNVLHTFVATELERVEGFVPEEGVEPVELTPAQLRQAIVDGEFDHAMHLGVLLAALAKGQAPGLDGLLG
jgi:ADP-ribose pyrophosphatase